ncbi:ribonuclease H-like domain-containing protein [Tanacetum coccineum]
MNQQMRVKETVQEKEGEASKKSVQNVQDLRAELDNLLVQQKQGYAKSTNIVSIVSPYVSAARQSFINANDLPTDPLMPDLEDTTDLLNTGIFSGAYDDEDVGAEADLNNLETTMNVSPIPITRIHKDHPKEQIIGDPHSAPQTKRMTKSSQEHAMVSYIKKQRRTNHKDYQNCLFAYFLSQIEPKKVTQALTDPSWIEAMQDELLQFRLQKVWRLVDLPKGKHAIGTKWVYRNKIDERGIIVRNKARLMDVKSAFLYGTIEEEVYVCQPSGFEDPQFLDKVYKVIQRDDCIFISQDKYVADILNKFNFSSVKTTSTPIETNKALLKDEEAEDVDVHLYRSMIRSLMYLTASRLDIMFDVCACARDSPFNLEAFSDSDYAGASLDRKSTTGVFHSKTKHIEIRHHFIRDSYEKKLIQLIKIYTDHNVADLLTKAFDVSRLIWFGDGISDEFGVKTGSCKVNAARQDLVLLGKS